MSFISLFSEVHQNFVSYEFSGGRFGDNLIAYLRAKWLSYQYQVPLLYKPFQYSQELILDNVEIPYSQSIEFHFRKISYFKQKPIKAYSSSQSKLYVCEYFPECHWERSRSLDGFNKPWQGFDVNWKDPFFRALLKPLILPKKKLSLVDPPQDRINIAVHIREGGTFDTGDFALLFITKFPPVEFYIQGLLNAIQLFPGKSFYCYLFTDAENPFALVEKIHQALPADTSITFDFRTFSNHHDHNVLEDFFSLFQFDVLIHSQSNFSLVPALIHDYAVTYKPLSGCRKGNQTKIDQAQLEVNESLLQELLLR